ncbi:MAG: hypothetical protein LBG46_07640, partial [Elusimicrobiota bacterium]|nr:hypothetical protein [Elusimicrobiota bacterium]
MRNISIILLLPFLFIHADLQAQSNMRGFNYNYEINVVEGLTPQENASAFKCQATRLSKEWFITAAHCLQHMCGNGCILQARLFVSPDYEMDMQTKISSASDNAVKIFAGGNSNKAVYDIALIKFTPEKSQYVYRNNKTGYRISEGDFINEIGKQKHNLAAHGTDFPALLKLKNKSLSVLDSKLIVAYVSNGRAGELKSFAPVFYSPQKNFLFTLDFGIESG